MDPADFSDRKPGELVKNLDGVLAFVPNPLPPVLNWSNELVNAVAAAESALGKLSGLGQKFPQPRRLARMFLRREAELSSRIENTYAGVRTQLLFKFLPDIKDQTPDVVEVENNFRALEYGLRAIKSRPITQSLIKEMHGVLMRGARGEELRPGEYRRVQAHIGRSNNIHEARFVPPPPHAIQDCMDPFGRFLSDESDVPRVVKLAMMHYQFEAIHPFADGNGRIGRVLILLLMCQSGMLPLPLFNPSAPLERNRRSYYDHLLDVSMNGAWEEWIRFFSRGIVEECEATIKKIQKLEGIRRKYQALLAESGSSAKLTKLVDALFAQPRLRLEDVQKIMEAWPTSAQRFIRKLLELEILREATGGKRNRIYLAEEIIAVFTTDEVAP